MNFKKLKNPLLLLLAAFIWGAAFVFQKSHSVPPFMFNVLRSIVGGTVLIPIIAIMGKRAPQPVDGKPSSKKLLILGGSLCGIALAVASAFQQYGIQAGADAGKAGFLTAMYIVLVPIFGIFLKVRTTLKSWISVAISVIGLYLLCYKGGIGFTSGDLIVLCCAFVFAVHILIIDHFSSRVEAMKMSCIQFFVCAAVSLVFSLIWGERLTLDILKESYSSILYLGVLSSGAGYTLQIVAQRDTHPALASIIMSLESVFAVLASTIAVLVGFIDGDILTLREALGCAIMFGAIILSQLPERKKTQK